MKQRLKILRPKNDPIALDPYPLVLVDGKADMEVKFLEGEGDIGLLWGKRNGFESILLVAEGEEYECFFWAIRDRE